jgi:DNA-binding response OmpR family regulator
MSQDCRAALVVEDSPLLRQGLALIFENAGCSVTIAATVAEALAALDGKDLALVDLGLPDGSGDQVLHEIRRRGLPIRVAIMSAGAAPKAIEALELRPSETYFAKPLDLKALIEWIGCVNRPPNDAATLD